MKLIQVQEWLEKNANLLMVALVVYAVVRGLVAAATEQLSFDEILTQIVASQPGLKGIWAALSKAVDGQAPAHYVIERTAMGLVSNVHVALRIPPILATACILVFLFVYLRRRSGGWVAFLCAFLILSTSVFRYFADVARPYTMFLACFAFALVCYQRLPSLLWTALLALSLALAQCLHYYAIFVLVPFGLAECVHLLKDRRFRWQAWAALGTGALPLAFIWPLLSAMKNYFGAHYWTFFGPTDIVKVYGSLLWTTTATGVGVAAICIVGVIAPSIWPELTDSAASENNGDDLAEAFLAVGFLLLPFVVFVITKLMHGGMLDRYAIAVLLGVPLALGRIFSRANAKAVALYAIFLFAAVGLTEISFWRSVHAMPPRPIAPPVEKLVASAGHPDLLVVVSNGLAFLPLVYYAAPEWKHRFVYLYDPEKALRYVGTDNVDKVDRNLLGYFPLEIPNYDEFVRAHPTFLLYKEEPTAFDWLPSHLEHVGATLQTVVKDQTRTVYLVTMRPGG
jgi:hypothetical protein